MPTIDKIAWVEVRDRKALYLRSKGNDVFYNPGGKREGSESDAGALIRELREELTVAVLPETIEYLATFSAQAHGKPEGTLVEIACYAARVEGNLSPAAEIEEMAWFTSADRERTTATGKLILDWLKEQDFID